MHEAKLRRLLSDLKEGVIDIDEAARSLCELPFQDLGFARVDHHRALRCGRSEVIFCEGKTPEQVAAIATAILSQSDVLLGTRATKPQYEAVRREHPDARYDDAARCIVIMREPAGAEGEVLVLSAGTSDLPVAAEAKVTAEVLGAGVRMINDVGVAGLHRLLSCCEDMRTANVIVVVAGMEGALPSVVGGLAACPVIAVPTSVGYGASFGGLAPLLTMLNSCAAGIAVVNIDNGFGAGYMAATINALAVGKDVNKNQNHTSGTNG